MDEESTTKHTRKQNKTKQKKKEKKKQPQDHKHKTDRKPYYNSKLTPCPKNKP
ncbi:hypothetical protein LguiA_007709 [Lonicera macranthoides]